MADDGEPSDSSASFIYSSQIGCVVDSSCPQCQSLLTVIECEVQILPQYVEVCCGRLTAGTTGAAGANDGARISSFLIGQPGSRGLEKVELRHWAL